MVSTVLAPAKELILTSLKERSPAEDEPLFGGVAVTSGPSLTRKRTRASSADTIISSAEVPGVTSEPELEDPRSAKRRGSAEQRPESLILDSVSIPKSTPLSTSSDPVSRSRASKVPLYKVIVVENRSDGAHSGGTGEELLRFSRGSISPFEGMQGDQDVGLGSDRREEKSNASDGEVGESYKDEINQADNVSRGASARLLSNVNQGIADSGRRGAVRHNLLLDHGTGAGCLREHRNK